MTDNKPVKVTATICNVSLLLEQLDKDIENNKLNEELMGLSTKAQRDLHERMLKAGWQYRGVVSTSKGIYLTYSLDGTFAYVDKDAKIFRKKNQNNVNIKG